MGNTANKIDKGIDDTFLYEPGSSIIIVARSEDLIKIFYQETFSIISEHTLPKTLNITDLTWSRYREKYRQTIQNKIIETKQAIIDTKNLLENIKEVDNLNIYKLVMKNYRLNESKKVFDYLLSKESDGQDTTKIIEILNDERFHTLKCLKNKILKY